MDFLIYCVIVIAIGCFIKAPQSVTDNVSTIMSDNNIPIRVDLPLGSNLGLKKISQPYTAILKELGLM